MMSKTLKNRPIWSHYPWLWSRTNVYQWPDSLFLMSNIVNATMNVPEMELYVAISLGRYALHKCSKGLWCGKSIRKVRTLLGHGGGQVVSLLAIYTVDHSSNPAEVYIFFSKKVLQKYENKQKRARDWPQKERTWLRISDVITLPTGLHIKDEIVCLEKTCVCIR